MRLWDAATGAPLAVLEGHTGSVNGARALDGGRLLSWSDDKTLLLWDAVTFAPRAVFATAADWACIEAEIASELTRHRPHNRALHHSLHLGYDVHEAKDDLAVFTAGRHLRICRFIPARTAA
jgi:WD40 repeat protein